MILTRGDQKVLTCIEKSCYKLENNRWKYHSELTVPRSHAISISMPNGVYLFGGTEVDSVESSTFLPKNKRDWIHGPAIPSPGIYKVGCLQLLCLALPS